MKRKIIKAIASILLATGILAGGGAIEAGAAAKTVSLAQAKTIALRHAGVAAKQAASIRARQEWDDGRQEYEIEFRAGGWEYEYTVLRAGGRIVEYDRERLKTSKPKAEKPKAKITLEKAIATALGHAGFTAKQVKFTKARLEYDHGAAEYEIEFRAGRYEWEYTIHAGTGRILEAEKERD
jgi:uncharacterized membrane protein YkoI